MKKLYAFLSILLVTLVCATNAWGAEKTITFTNVGKDLPAAASTTIQQVTINGYVFNHYQCKKQTSASNSYVFLTKEQSPFFGNQTPIPGKITSIKVVIPNGAAKATSYKIGFSSTPITHDGQCTIGLGKGTGTSFTATNTNGGEYFAIALGNKNNGQIYEISVTYEDAPAYTITAVANPSDGGTVSVSGTKITAEPNEGYQIDATNPYTVTSGSATVSQNGNEFTVTPTANCTIQINFAKLQEHTITWMVNGKEYKTTTTTGKIVLPTEPAAPSSCSDKKFMGWATSPTVDADGIGVTYIDENTTISADATYYAVFATAGSGGGTSKTLDITISNFTEITTSYTTTFTHNYADATVEAHGVYKNSNGIQMNSGKGTYIKNTTSLAGPITNITCTWTATGKNSPTIYVAKDKVASSSSVSLEKQSSTITTQSIDVNGADGYNYFYFDGTTVTGACCLTSLKITYGGVAKYTDYTTTCETCTDLEVTWNEMTATVNGQHGATLSWTATPTTNIAGYRVRVWSNASEVYNKTFDVTTTMLTLNDLLHDTWYRWEVTALPKDGSGFCPVTSSEGPTFKTEGAIKLATPTNPLVVYNEATNNYTFSWDAVANATKYTMRGQFSGDMGKNTTSSTRTLPKLIPGTEYTVYVKAVGDGGDYTDSDEAQYTFTAHTYTLTLSVMENGVPTTNTYTVPKYTLSAATSSCDEYTFAGWSETALTDPTTTAPTLIAAGTEYAPDNGYIKSDRTLYAVFSKVDEETVSDTYEKVTTKDDMTNGNYMIVGLGASSTYYALTSTPVTTNGWFKGSSLGKSSALSYSTTDPTQIWEIKKEGTNYLIYNAAKKQYLNINSSTLVMEDAGIPYTLSVAYAGNVLFKSTKNTSYYLASHTGQAGIFNAYTQANTVYLYKNTTTCIYTTAPSCVDCTQEGADCPEYPLVLNDRGILDTVGTYWVGKEITKEEIEKAYTPQGGCEGYEFAGWTTEAGLSNLTAEEWKSKMVTFPIRMPKSVSQKPENEQKLTLYAVYSSVWTDEYRLVTGMSDLTTGEYVITALAGGQEHALSFVRSDYIENFGSQPVEITQDEDGMGIVSTTNPEIIWTITATTDGGYTLEALHFDGMQNKSYLNIVSNYLQFEETAKPYTISEGDTYAAFTLCSQEGYCLSYSGTDFVAGETASKLYLYKRVKDTRYSTSTACDPSIISVGTVAVTSAQGIWVEAVTQPYVFAEHLNLNRDGAAGVDIIATSKTAQFTLKAVGATGAGNASLTLKEGETRDNFADRFMVVYKPIGYDVIEEGEIVVKAVNHDDHSKEYAVHTIRVKGRSLPKQFVIAAQTANGWVALPADLGTSSLAVLKAPYRIEVDNEADPTKATQAPKTALYSAAGRFHENTNPRGVRLVNRSGMSLCGDYTKDPDHRLWLSEGEVVNSQSWALRSLRLKDYYIRLQASPAGHYLFYNATIGNGKIGYYEYLQQNRLRLRLLPVEVVCVRYDAPAVQVGQLKSTSVTLTWPYVKDMPGYEYTLDGGATWTAFVEDVNWTVEGTTNIGTIEGLTAKGTYTVSVRVVAPEGRENCSDEGTRTFSLPECDDAPHNLWATATADAVHIMWEADAATATVKIYSDEAGTAVVTTQTNVASPCKITGLTQNTKYWYQVFADGTCASAIASFTTESSDISIVEWDKNAIIVDINTEVGTGVDVVVEKHTEHGEHNYAEDLFFSKYFEASGSIKLLGIFNGTDHTISLADTKIYLGTKSTGWNYSVLDLSTYGSIAPNQEIILWTKGKYDVPSHNSYETDKAIVECVERNVDIKDFKELDSEQLKFSGRQSFALSRDNDIIDIIGAATFNDGNLEKKATITGTYPEEGTIRPVWTGTVEEGESKPKWGDSEGWVGSGYSQDDPTQIINLSTNRCLLVRSNTVRSGADAIAKNIQESDAGFVTLGSYDEGGNPTKVGEWSGKQVWKVQGTDPNGVQLSCEGFSYVADFNYSNYYVTYDKIENTIFHGTPNPNGTYTIEVPELGKLACTDIRLQLTKGEEVTASREQKVPIIVYENANTNTAKFFHADGLDAAVCADCDVVVRDQSMLTNVSEEGAIQQFRDMFIYHDSRLEIPEGTHMKLDKLRMFALNDDVSYAIINNADGETPAISINEISHVKRIDGKYWYPFSLPYNCRIADIGALNGKDLGTYGVDWGIKYYDGQKRQQDGKSASIGGVSDYWYMMNKDDLLEAYKGYIIGLFVPASEEANQKSINFAPANIKPYTETAESKTTLVQNWPDNLEAAPRHHGWNFTGSPYISLFGVVPGQGLYNAQLKMGWTDIYGEQQDNGNIYISIPDGGNSRTYTQSLASGIAVKPFTAYFVQTIDPQDGSGHTLELTYNKAHRRLPQPQQMPNMTLMPSRAAEETSVLFAELTITAEPADGQTKVLTDNAGVQVNDRFSADYEIGYDLTKMYAAADKPQLYTVAADNEKMAYNALPDALAHSIPLGIYLPKAGDYTVSLNRNVSSLEDAQSVCLLHNGVVVADLLHADYTIVATAKGEQAGYMLDIRRTPQVITSAETVGQDAPYVIYNNGMLTIGNLPSDANLQIYDVLGRLIWNEQHIDAASSVVVPASQTGVYMIVVDSDAAPQQYILKSLVR